MSDRPKARIDRGKIYFPSKVLVDRGIAQNLDDFKSGRSYGLFKTHPEFVASLDAHTGKLQPSKRIASR